MHLDFLRVYLALLEDKEIPGLQEKKVSGVLVVPKVPWDLPETRGYQALKVALGLEAHQGQLEILVHQEFQASLVPLESLGSSAHLD